MNETAGVDIGVI